MTHDPGLRSRFRHETCSRRGLSAASESSRELDPRQERSTHDMHAITACGQIRRPRTRLKAIPEVNLWPCRRLACEAVGAVQSFDEGVQLINPAFEPQHITDRQSVVAYSSHVAVPGREPIQHVSERRRILVDHKHRGIQSVQRHVLTVVEGAKVVWFGYCWYLIEQSWPRSRID